MGQRGVGGAGRAEGGAGGAGGGPGRALGPLKSADKPHPWAVDHGPMGPGAMGPVGGGVRGGVGWKCGCVGVGVGVGGWGWQGACGVGVGVGGGGGAGAIFLTSIGSHAGRGMKNGTRSHGSMRSMAGCVGGLGKGGVC